MENNLENLIVNMKSLAGEVDKRNAEVSNFLWSLMSNMATETFYGPDGNPVSGVHNWIYKDARKAYMALNDRKNLPWDNSDA